MGYAHGVPGTNCFLNQRVPADLFVYTPEEIQRLADRPFIRQALAEGETVYAAGSNGLSRRRLTEKEDSSCWKAGAIAWPACPAGRRGRESS